ncbi:hypothetical protein ACFPK9_00555 [Rubritalea spongiae]|uniref:Tetratricopeptide repeat protein n=1 Tax=Rubritalea spongiae TaxID=430797 RepID=A0ABW5E3A6_9BACT
MSKSLKVFLCIAAFSLLLFCCYTLYNYSILSLRVKFADDQTLIFDEAANQAMQGSPQEAIKCLEYVISYYPSGSKQELGSSLDILVERARANTIKIIIDHLRSETKLDLGNSPKAWIDHYTR